MLVFLAAAPDISGVPGEDVKNILLVVAFLLAMGLNGYAILTGRRAQKNEVTGTIDTKPAHDPASKSELDAVKQSIATLSEKLDNKVEALMQAGQHRAEIITKKIDDDIKMTRMDIDQRIKAVDDKINEAGKKDATHDEAISTLKTENIIKTQQIQRIFNNLPAKARLS